MPAIGFPALAAGPLGRVGVACLAVLGLAACGGGGGGGPAPAALTAANAELISAEVLAVIDVSEGLGATSAGATISGEPGGPQALRLRGATRRTALRAGTLEVFGPELFACDVSGTVTLTIDVADFDVLTAGDVITAVYSNCDDGFGDIVNGRLRFVVVAWNPASNLDLGLIDVTFDATFTAFRITDEDGTFTTDGAARVLVDTLQSPEEVTLTGSRLVFTEGGKRYTLTDFATTLLVNLAANPVTATGTATGTLAASSFTGRVDFATILPLVALGTDPASTGEVEVYGAADSLIRITVLDAVNLSLAVDVDGDGNTDVTIPTTWAALATLSG